MIVLKPRESHDISSVSRETRVAIKVDQIERI